MMTEIAMETTLSFRGLLMILLGLLLVGAIVYRAYKGQWWPAVLLLMVVLFGGLIVSYRMTAVPAPLSERNLAGDPRERPFPPQGSRLPDDHRSTAELWDRITTARIRLDEEGTSLPEKQAQTKSEASDATGETASAVGAPSARPAWVDDPPKPVGNVFRTVRMSDPFSTEDECYEQLEGRFRAETTRQLQRIVPSDQQSLVDEDSLARMGISLSYVMKEICRESYTETVDSSVGMMKKVHVLMEFGPGVEDHLLTAWSAYQRQFRLTLVSKIAAFVLAALATVYGLLQLDTWTRGYYTKRLLVGVPAAIIAIAVLLFVV